jgi:cytochrome c
MSSKKTYNRKNTLKPSLMTVVLALVPVWALASQELAFKHQCMNCHQIESKRIGPPFRAIAQRYSPMAAAMVPHLARKIRSGGKGIWGQVGMPAMNKVSETEAMQLATWILQLP